MTSTDHILVIGYGNTLRGDDGVGQEVAEAIWLQRDRLPGLPRAQVLWAAQLTPELALDVSSCALAVFIDAARDGRPAGSVAVELVVAPPAPDSVPARASSPDQGVPVGCWQDLSPAGLLQMASDLFGQAPVGVMVTVSIASADPGNGLSPLVAAAVPRAVAAVRLAIATSLRSSGAGRSLAGARRAPGGASA